MGTARRERNEEGSASIELILGTPLVIVLLLFVVFAGRVAHARMITEDVAHQAARSASLQRDPTAARAAADATVAATTSGSTCKAVEAVTDTAGFAPGGSVTVTVTCRADLADLSLLALPGETSISSSSTSPIDIWRSSTREAE